MVKVTTAGAPTARRNHTAIWNGSQMVVWGGWDGTNSFNTGARYNPAGNTWTATNPTGAPTNRNQHTAVWTGTEMIVWGGASGSAGADPVVGALARGEVSAFFGCVHESPSIVARPSIQMRCGKIMVFTPKGDRSDTDPS
jgi:hypothetical protein